MARSDPPWTDSSLASSHHLAYDFSHDTPRDALLGHRTLAASSEKIRMDTVLGFDVRPSCRTPGQHIEEMACEMRRKELIDTAIWPEDVRTTPVANIKEESESPALQDVRPITLAATLHCAWSSTRYREATARTKHAWLHKTVHGGIPRASLQNAIWPLLLKMEAMTKDEKEYGIATAAIDSEMYFDCICWEVTFQMLDEMGLDQRIWKPMLNFIVQPRRFNKVAGTMDPTWTWTNNIIQGCSLSLLATAALSTVFARALEAEYWQSSATALWMIVDPVRRENHRQNSCRQTSKSHATSTRRRRQDSIQENRRAPCHPDSWRRRCNTLRTSLE